MRFFLSFLGARLVQRNPSKRSEPAGLAGIPDFFFLLRRAFRVGRRLR
jgi:hypothetical protein